MTDYTIARMTHQGNSWFVERDGVEIFCTFYRKLALAHINACLTLNTSTCEFDRTPPDCDRVIEKLDGMVNIMSAPAFVKLYETHPLTEFPRTSVFPEETRTQLLRAKWFTSPGTGLYSTKMVNVLPRKLTVRRDYDIPTETLFEECHVVPFDEMLNEAEKALMRTPHHGTSLSQGGYSSLSRDGYFDRYERILKDALKRMWAPGKFHLLLNSSGYDSRHYAYLLRELRKEEGDDWLGDVLFACLGAGEGQIFQQIMERLDWEKRYWHVYSDYGTYFDRCTDFKRAGARTNHLQSFALDIYWVLPRELQWLGLIPHDDDQVQMFAGYWGGELADRFTLPSKDGWPNNVHSVCESIYASNQVLGLYAFEDTNHLFGDYSAVEFIVNHTYPERSGRLRLACLEHCDPMLADFEYTQIVKHCPQIPRRFVVRTVEDYKASWYGQNVAPGMERTVTSESIYNRWWWLWWTRAALCERLLREGYELEVAQQEGE